MTFWRPHLKSKRITDFFGRKARKVSKLDGGGGF